MAVKCSTSIYFSRFAAMATVVNYFDNLGPVPGVIGAYMVVSPLLMAPVVVSVTMLDSS